MKSRVQEKLRQGQTVTGMINFIGSPMAIEIMARAGIDFSMIDMEHCALDLNQLAHTIRAADAAGISPFVRVPDVDKSLIMRVLDLGAEGLVIPHASKERCERLLEISKYAPEGKRGACPIVRASRYWPDDWNAYARQANSEIVLLPLLEDKHAIEDFEAIAALPGIPAYFIGPYDLSVSLGVPGLGFDNPKMSDALDRVLAIAGKHGKYVFTTVGDRQERAYTQALLARGVHGVLFATDGLVFLQACQRLVSHVHDEA